VKEGRGGAVKWGVGLNKSLGNCKKSKGKKRTVEETKNQLPRAVNGERGGVRNKRKEGPCLEGGNGFRVYKEGTSFPKKGCKGTTTLSRKREKRKQPQKKTREGSMGSWVGGGPAFGTSWEKICDPGPWGRGVVGGRRVGVSV